MSAQIAAELSPLFSHWQKSKQNFEDRDYVKWHGSFYTVAGSPPGMGSVSKACKTAADVVAFLATFDAPAPEPAPEPIPEPPPEVIAEPVVEVEDEPVPDPRDARIAELEARIAELETPPETPPLTYPDEAPAEPAPEPYTPNFSLIPEPLARYANADEGSAEFRARLKSYWQRFGIADGENFPGGGEPLTADEKIQMREIDILLNSDEGKAARLHDWLFAD